MPENFSLSIRRARGADATVLAELGARTFYDTFVEFNTPEDMTAYLDGAFRPDIQAAELADPYTIYLLAEINQVPVGYAQLRIDGSAPEFITGPRPIELRRFYVSQEWHGKGIANALMEAYLKEAEEGGFQTLWLAVWEQNHRAKAFYRKWGFEDVGSKIFILGIDEQIDRVLARPLFLNT